MLVQPPDFRLLRAPVDSLLVRHTSSRMDGDLTQSTSREHRLYFLLKSLKFLADERENVNSGQITAERARKGLDFAVLTLYFELVPQLNGKRSNRPTIQAAC